LITFEQARAIAGPVRLPGAAAQAPPHAAPAATHILHAVLLLTILLSPFVFVEPSPYEAATLLLGFACLIARVPFDRRIVPLMILLIVWLAGGGVALFNMSNDDTALRYGIISVFMAFTAVLYAALFSDDTLRRMRIMRGAYIAAAAMASIIGAIGYFDAFPGAAELFATIGRANATFKDPNVFGPFLILPLLFLVQSGLTRGIRPISFVLLLIIAMGLLLSFSRGAWAHFTVSASVMIILMLLTAPDLRTRAKLIALTVLAAATLLLLLAGALSIDAIGDMFRERAKLIQTYDAGSSMSRFHLQRLALNAIIENPMGIGPYAFSGKYGLQQHNVYLQSFLVYGWLGGGAYLGMMLLTLGIGFRAMLVATPWRPALIAIYAAFAGEIFEGMVIDTDHWRHYFLLVGLIWGLAAATRKYASARAAAR
jgi:O-antigen ligase